MPLSKHYKGSGEKVAKNMKEEYGDRWKEVFYATENKQKAAEDHARSYAEGRNAARKKRG